MISSGLSLRRAEQQKQWKVAGKTTELNKHRVQGKIGYRIFPSLNYNF